MSATTDTRRRAVALPPEERRAAIVAVALPLLIEHGEAITTRQVADAAGIAEGTIFRVFPDKDALLDAIVEAALDTEPLDRTLAAVDPELDFEVALEWMVAVLQRRAIELWHVMSVVGKRMANKPHSRHVSEPMVAYFTARADRISVAPQEAAQLLRGLTAALSYPSLIEEPMPPKHIVDVFLHGAGAR